MFDRFQRISQNATFTCNHTWKMEKSSWQGRICFFIVFRSIKSPWHNQSWSSFDLSLNALKLMHSYVSNRKQQVQINTKFSSKNTVIVRVRQGSIDGPLLFNLFVNDLVFFIQYCTLSNYAEDNNLFSKGTNKDQIKSFLSS